MNKIITTSILILLFLFQGVAAQNTYPKKQCFKESYGYIGVKGGMPFGVSMFSSFGHDKPNIGWSTGVFGGYQFNSLISLEGFAEVGHMNMTSKSKYSDYSLVYSGNQYFSNSQSGLDGWAFSELKSHVFFQKYGAQMNLNLLGFCCTTSQSRWKLELSPVIGAIGTKATIKPLHSSEKIIKGDTKWHATVGGKLGASFSVTPLFSIGVYSGIEYITGKMMDGMPKVKHQDNYIWESGIRAKFCFGRSKKVISYTDTYYTKGLPGYDYVVLAPLPEPEPELIFETVPEVIQFVTQTTSEPQQPSIINRSTVQQREVRQTVSIPVIASTGNLYFPVLYFLPKGIDLDEQELPKVARIARTLKQNPGTRIVIRGYTEPTGDDEQNTLYCTKRANVVYKRLIGYEIEPERMTTEVGGVDNNPDTSQARRVDIALVD